LRGSKKSRVLPRNPTLRRGDDRWNFIVWAAHGRSAANAGAVEFVAAVLIAGAVQLNLLGDAAITNATGKLPKKCSNPHPEEPA
jgi:hypothetical protein